MLFSEMLRTALKEQGMKAADLSAATGIGKSSISMYLSGKVDPPDKKKKQIALAMGLEADYFSKVFSKANLPVTTAAKLMGKSPRFVYLGLQQGVFPFGYAVKNSTQWTYYISPAKFMECTGIQIPAPVDEEESGEAL